MFVWQKRACITIQSLLRLSVIVHVKNKLSLVTRAHIPNFVSKGVLFRSVHLHYVFLTVRERSSRQEINKLVLLCDMAREGTLLCLQTLERDFRRNDLTKATIESTEIICSIFWHTLSRKWFVPSRIPTMLDSRYNEVDGGWG